MLRQCIDALQFRKNVVKGAIVCGFDGSFIISSIADVSADDEFKHLRKMPGYFQKAAVHNPTDPRIFLRRECPRQRTPKELNKACAHSSLDRTD